MKRRQRAGLPIYPQDQVRDEVAAGFLVQQQKEQEQHQQIPQYEQGRKRPNYNSCASSLSSYQLSSSKGKKQCNYNNIPCNFSSLDSISLSSAGQNEAVSSFFSNLNPHHYFKLHHHHHHHHHDNSTTATTANIIYSGGSFTQLALSPNSSFVPSRPDLCKEDITSAQLSSASSFQLINSGSFGSLLMGAAQTEPTEVDFVAGLKEEVIASSQTPPQPTATTPASSSGNTNNNSYCDQQLRGSTGGLLDALLAESRYLSVRNQRNKTNGQVFLQEIDKGKCVLDAASVEEEEGEPDGDKRVVDNRRDDFGSNSHSSMGKSSLTLCFRLNLNRLTP